MWKEDRHFRCSSLSDEEAEFLELRLLNALLQLTDLFNSGKDISDG